MRHGTLAEVECLACRWCGPSTVAHESLDAGSPVPTCPLCGAPLKPAVVLFGELLPDAFRAASEAAAGCDLLLCLGSSL